LVDGRPVVLDDIRIPIFAVGAERDHVAPWRSVYKISMLADADVTFLLTSGGHNAGIVRVPGHINRHYRVDTKRRPDRYVDPDTWLARTPEKDGSWWPALAEWLAAHSGGETPPPAMGAAKRGYPVLGDAPGQFVVEP
jgi:polyhydroxyalkanoate synthase